MDPGTAISVIPVFIPAAEFIITLIAILITAARTIIPDPMPGARVSEIAAVVVVIAAVAAVAVAEGTDVVLTDFSQTYPSGGGGRSTGRGLSHRANRWSERIGNLHLATAICMSAGSRLHGAAREIPWHVGS